MRLLLLLAVVASVARAGKYGVPAPPLDEIYSRFYTIMPDSKYCVVTAEVYQNVSLGARSPRIAGCSTPNGEQDNMLAAIGVGDVTRWRSASAAFADPESDAAVAAAARALVGTVQGTRGGVMLVFDRPSPEGSFVYNASWLFRVVATVNAAGMLAAGRINGLSFWDAALSTAGMAAASPNAYVSLYALPATWVYRYNLVGSRVPATGQIWTEIPGMTLLKFTDATGYAALTWEARYNTAKVRERGVSDASVLSPQYAAQTAFGMYMLQRPVPAAVMAAADAGSRIAPTCLSLAHLSCLPIGGESVWATTRAEQPSAIDEPAEAARVEKNVPQRTILLVASTSSSGQFQESVPAADDAASGLVATAAVVDAIKRVVGNYLRTSADVNVSETVNGTTSYRTLKWTPTQIAVLFAMGDGYDNMGSARFIKELHEGVGFCRAMPSQTSPDRLSCRIPWMDSTNFTSMNFSDFTHIIHIDQVGRPAPSGPPLFVHEERTYRSSTQASGHGKLPTFDFSGSASQQRVTNEFLQSGVTQSTATQLPARSIAAFYPAVARKNVNLAANPPAASNATADGWVDTWRGRHTTTTLHCIAAYDASFTNTDFESEADTASKVNVTNIVAAAQAVANVLSNLLFAEYAQFVTMGMPAYGTPINSGVPLNWTAADFVFAVDVQLVSALWPCFTTDIGCDFVRQTLNLNTRHQAANYYPGVFLARYFRKGIQQQLIMAYLEYTLSFTPDAVPTPCSACASDQVCTPRGCAKKSAFYHHAYSVGIEMVDAGGIIAYQETPAAATSSDGLIDGVAASLYQRIWVESYWGSLGGRTYAREDEAKTAWVFVVGVVCTLACGGIYAVLLLWVVPKLKEN